MRNLAWRYQVSATVSHVGGKNALVIDNDADLDEAAAAEFGRIGSMLAERGTPIGEFDVLIAAHAVTLRCTLVTNNVRHFSKVPGLSVENWA